MKLVYIARSSIPSRSANSVQVMKMCHAFGEIGHDVTLIVPNNGDTECKSENYLFRSYGIDRNFRILRVPDPPAAKAKRLWAWRAATLANSLLPEVCYSRDPFASVFTACFDQPIILELHNISKEKIRRAQMKHKDRSALLAFRAKSILKSLSLVVQPVFEDIFLRSTRSLYRFARFGGFYDVTLVIQKLLESPQCLRLVAITHALADDFVELFPFARSKILVAPDGADPPSHTLPTVALRSDDTRLRVGYCGHLYPGKGMEVIEQLTTLCPWASFHIVGGTDHDVKAWQDRLSGMQNIYFYGYVEPTLVASYLKEFEVCLLPNQPVVGTHSDDGESSADIGSYTSPLKMFEYMSAGKPIIASDLAVLREVLKNDVNAILCPHDDARVWAATLERFARDKSLRSRLATRAQDDFTRYYTWQARARRVLPDIRL
jgi:glycosyltransferase involved in cell wall biosynthesis